EMSIPGTHDTCSLHGGDLVKCQAWSVKDQLEAGIRFIDIRCRHIENVFAIHHGIVYQKINFGKVRDACIAFLKANPSECVIMIIKEEHTPSKNTRKFSETFASYVKGNDKYFYQKEEIPKLKDARGKIVIVTRAGGVDGIPYSVFEHADDVDVSTV